MVQSKIIIHPLVDAFIGFQPPEGSIPEECKTCNFRLTTYKCRGRNMKVMTEIDEEQKDGAEMIHVPCDVPVCSVCSRANIHPAEQALNILPNSFILKYMERCGDKMEEQIRNGFMCPQCAMLEVYETVVQEL